MEITFVCKPNHKKNNLIFEIKNALRSLGRTYNYLQIIIGPVLRNDYLEKQFHQIVDDHPKKQFLNLGCGTSLGKANLKNLDCYLGSNVDIVADLHQIPLAENSLDGVTSVAVLEHIKEPTIVVKETLRILKPGAIAHFNIPFMQPYHASPDDFQRFTSSGLRHLFRNFEIIELQSMGGPASAMFWLTTEFLSISLSFGIKQLHALLFILFTSILWPFKFLDIILRCYPTSQIMTSNFSLLLRKPKKKI